VTDQPDHRKIRMLARALGFDLIACDSDKYAIEERATRGNRWPEFGGESLAVIATVLRRINLREWGGD
jgi:hypothetical protein